MTILITGGCGFIGSTLVRYLYEKGETIVNMDCMSYNSRTPDISLSSDQDTSRYTLIRKNLTDHEIIDILERYDVRYVYHLAAQTHVDLSFRNSVKFSEDNVVGTHNLLDAVCKYGKVKRFIHMSTDEVYGQVFDNANESTIMNPTNPYAATKCGAEM